MTGATAELPLPWDPYSVVTRHPRSSSAWRWALATAWLGTPPVFFSTRNKTLIDGFLRLQLDALELRPPTPLEPT
jgi:hypothetical protein